MFFLPAMAAYAVATSVTVGEAIGIGTSLLGIGIGIKGAVDYRKAKKLKAEADEEYRIMAARIRRRTARLKKSYGNLAA